MSECKLLLNSLRYSLHLSFNRRFVDRDMLMHHLGYGIGHKGYYASRAESSDGAPRDEDDQEMDNLDKQNSDTTNLQPMELEEAVDDARVEEAIQDADVEEVVDDAQGENGNSAQDDDGNDAQDDDDNDAQDDGGDDAQDDGGDDVYSRHSDADSELDPDDEDDLDGHL